MLAVAACGGGTSGDGGGGDLPPTDAVFDYQVGAVYAPADGVAVVSRDRLADPAPGLYNICYINGFQIKPAEADLWGAALVLRDASGAPVIDAAWNEALVDVRTAASRAAAAAIVDAARASRSSRSSCGIPTSSRRPTPTTCSRAADARPARPRFRLAEGREPGASRETLGRSTGVRSPCSIDADGTTVL